VVELTPGDNVVKRTAISESARSWVVDYSEARARAIKWLGDRYLLARPINATESAWRRTHAVNSHPRASDE